MRACPSTAFLILWLALAQVAWGQTAPVTFRVLPVFHLQSFQVSLEVSGIKRDTLSLKMPAWTPGYYQLLHFADLVSNVKATNSARQPLAVVKSGRNGWKVATNGSGWVQVSYEVTAKRTFVATPFVTDDRAYISPPGVFMHIEGELKRPAIVLLDAPDGWQIATGLDLIRPRKKLTATDFDVLYDSPILMGKLEELPAFEVKKVRHRFLGYKLGDFDRETFIKDLQKIVEVSVAVFGEIPYKQYTFIAIGPGPGGIEHLNSTSFGFAGESLKTRDGTIRMYAFLAHEYFHHYNVKRIRPVELGPFDYDRENRTNMLWVSEGLTVYYDLLLTYRAGLMTREELFRGIASRIASYENQPGKNFQSATQASYNTWSDGPFGRTEDEVNKTVSVYDKGAALGMLLDFAIRNASGNAKSLDDVMRRLYKEYYKGKKRGFTEAEFRTVCEQEAGIPLTELFEYASTTRPVDYGKYFAFAGLLVDSESKPVSGGWLGISARKKGDSLVVASVDYESPAWNAGLRRGMTFASESGLAVESVMKGRSSGETVVLHTRERGSISLTLGTKREASFEISTNPGAAATAARCRDQWLYQKD